ncbi:MAG: UDPGP type 1 family protein [Lentisphaeria bacterium]
MGSTAVPLYEDLKETLEAHGQAHLLNFWSELSDSQKRQLAGQLQALDWEQLDAWIEQYVLQEPEQELPSDLEPAEYYPVHPHSDENRQKYEEAEKEALELLRSGKVGGFTVAGGQGTRLGYDGPKGTYPIAPITGKSLFQLFAEMILRAQEKYETVIPWYIMTSPINDEPTREFFAKNEFFGLNSDNLFFLQQGTLPAIGYDGKLLLADKDSLALSPDGHGGSLKALKKSGALEDMKRRGIEHLSYWQVDNPLVQPLDRRFLGLHQLDNADVSCRSLTKTGPYEKLGNFCVTDDKVLIVEYSDMPDDLARAQDAAGRLRFRAGSPAIHIFRREFIEALTSGHDAGLPVHRADKKVPHIDAQGQPIKPTEPNAVKLEMFIFDALPLADEVVIFEAQREEQFAPVKNAAGVDSAESCRKMMQERAARWLEDADISVPRRPNDGLDCTIEMSPRVFLDQEDVHAQAEHLRTPKHGQEEYYD